MDFVAITNQKLKQEHRAMMTRASDEENEKQRAAKQAEIQQRDKRFAEYRRAVEEEKMAGALVARGEKAGPYLEPFQQASGAAGRRVGAIDNDYPNWLINSCRNRELRDDFEVSQSLKSVARADHARTVQTLKSENDSLAILQSQITKTLGAPAILQPDDEMPWSAGVVARTVSALKIAFGSAVIAKWAVSHDRTAVAFNPSEVHETNQKHYANSWHGMLRDVRLAQASHDAAAQRLAECQVAFDEAKSAMIWSPI